MSDNPKFDPDDAPMPPLPAEQPSLLSRSRCCPDCSGEMVPTRLEAGTEADGVYVVPSLVEPYAKLDRYRSSSYSTTCVNCGYTKVYARRPDLIKQFFEER